jgi:hypothetical protein
MPADTDPATAGSNNDLIIEIEHHNRGLTNRCQSDETYPGRIPYEVVCPCMLAWVKDGTISPVSAWRVLVVDPLNSLQRRQAKQRLPNSV